jgi:hypothetical protein
MLYIILYYIPEISSFPWQNLPSTPSSGGGPVRAIREGRAQPLRSARRRRADDPSGKTSKNGLLGGSPPLSK